jgi:hypothetical protein
MAETEGFEPSIGLQTLYSLSRGAPSATRPHLQRDAILTRLTQLLSVTRINRSTIAKAHTGSEPTSLSRVHLNQPPKTQMHPHFD